MRDEIAEIIRHADFNNVGSYFIADQILTLLKERVGKFRHIPTGYHYVCWASGPVVVQDKWGHNEYYYCPHFNGDFNCGHRGCKDGVIKGVKSLTDYERHQTEMLDRILEVLK